MHESAWMPIGMDPEVPSAARVYDYFLGGYHNLAVDREFAHRAEQALPDLPLILRTMWLSAVRKSFQQHRRLAVWTFPVWAYVSVTGVLVYWMLHRLPV